MHTPDSQSMQIVRARDTFLCLTEIRDVLQFMYSKYSRTCLGIPVDLKVSSSEFKLFTAILLTINDF